MAGNVQQEYNQENRYGAILAAEEQYSAALDGSNNDELSYAMDYNVDPQIAQRKRILKNVLIGLGVVVILALFLVVVFMSGADDTNSTPTTNPTPTPTTNPTIIFPDDDDIQMRNTIRLNSDEATTQQTNMLHKMIEFTSKFSVCKILITTARANMLLLVKSYASVFQPLLDNLQQLETKLNTLQTKFNTSVNIIQQSYASLKILSDDVSTYSDKSKLTNKYALSTTNMDLLTTNVSLHDQYMSDLDVLLTTIKSATNPYIS